MELFKQFLPAIVLVAFFVLISIRSEKPIGKLIWQTLLLAAVACAIVYFTHH